MLNLRIGRCISCGKWRNEKFYQWRVSMKTKFGTTRFDGRYVRISSRKEGNEGKMLHRLVFEDFYQIKLPDDIVIHHNDGNPLNNEIWNLIPLTPSEHNTLHHKGIKHTEETKCKISNSMKGENNPFYGKRHTEETKQHLSEIKKGVPGIKLSNESKRLISLKKNTTGYRNVSIQQCPDCKQGFRYRYNYSIGGKITVIQSVSLEKLKDKVISKGWPWEKFAEA